MICMGVTMNGHSKLGEAGEEQKELWVVHLMTMLAFLRVVCMELQWILKIGTMDLTRAQLYILSNINYDVCLVVVM